MGVVLDRPELGHSRGNTHHFCQARVVIRFHRKNSQVAVLGNQ